MTARYEVLNDVASTALITGAELMPTGHAQGTSNEILVCLQNMGTLALTLFEPAPSSQLLIKRMMFGGRFSEPGPDGNRFFSISYRVGDHPHYLYVAFWDRTDRYRVSDGVLQLLPR